MRGFVRAAATALVLCAAATPLASCGAHAGATAPLTAAQTAQRAMLAAETAFNVAATAELDAKGVGLLTGDRAVEADKVRRQAYAALLGLRAAYALGQSPDVAGLMGLTNQLLELSGQTPPTVPSIPTL